VIFVPHEIHVALEQLVSVNRNLSSLTVFIAGLIVLAKIELLPGC